MIINLLKAYCTRRSLLPWVLVGSLLINGLYQILSEDCLGIGYDGRLYTELTRDFFQMAEASRIPKERVDRLLPFLLSHLLFRFFGLPTTDENIIHYFQLLNLILTALSSILFLRISRLLSLSTKNTVIWFVLLFSSFGVAKHPFYYPVLCDVWVFFLGMASVWAYLSGSQIFSVLLTIVGAFSWSTSVLFNLLWLLFPRNNKASDSERLIASPEKWSALVAGAMVLLMFCLLSPVEGLQLLIVRAVSLIALWFFLFIATSPFLTLLSRMDNFAPRRVMMRRIGLAILCVGVVATLRSYIESRYLSGPPLDWRRMFISHLPERATVMPAVFLVGHYMYFGFLMCLLIINWNKVVEAAFSKGTGAFLALGGALILSLNSESRHLIFLLPFVAILGAESYKDRAWAIQHLFMVVVLSLGIGHAWLEIGSNKQFYLVNFGNYVNSDQYLIFSLALVVGLLSASRILNGAKRHAS
jgi:hypothetical protein